MLMKYIYLLVVIIGLCFGGSAVAFPELTGQVVDTAGILSPATERQLVDLLKTETQHQVVVVTLDSLNGQSIEEYGYQLGRHWGIGDKGTDNGVLLIIAPTEGLVRIEVGYGLEGALTDALSSVIINQYMMPFLKEKKYDNASLIGVEGILAAIKGERFAPAMSAEEELGFMGLIFTILIIGLFVYVAAAPREQRAGRLRTVLFFMSLMPGRGSGFKGRGGRFGGGGSTGRF